MPPAQLISPRLRMLYREPVGGSDLVMRACGVREWMPPGAVHRPQGTHDYLFVTFRQPVAILTEAGLRTVPAGATLLSRPHAPHYFGSLSAPWCHSWLHCDGEAVRELLDDAGLPLDVPLSGTDHRHLDRCVLSLHEEARTHSSPDQLIMRHHLHIFLRELKRATAGTTTPIPRALSELRNHLDATFQQTHTLTELARRYGASVPHLCNRFRAAFKTSPIAYVIELRLRHARYLLSERNAGVAEAALAVGYGEYHHFSKLYRKRFGHWPSDARRR